MSTESGRNDPCPCGSGKKYKKCCLGKHQEAFRAEAKALREAPPPPPPADEEKEKPKRGMKEKKEKTHEHGPGCSHGKP